MLDDICDPGEGFVARIVPCMSKMIIGLGYDFTDAIFPVFQSAVFVFLTVCLLVFAVRLMMGGIEKIPRSTFEFALKFGIVYMFVSHLDVVMTWSFDILDGLLLAVSDATQLSTGYRCGTGSTMSIFTTAPTLWERIDCMLDIVIGLSSPRLLADGMLAFFFYNIFSGAASLIMGLIGLWITFNLVLGIFKAIETYLLTVFTIVMLVIIGILFIPLVFISSVEYFKNWFKMIGGAMVQPVVMFAYLNVVMAGLDVVLYSGEHSVFRTYAGTEVDGKDFNINDYIEREQLLRAAVPGPTLDQNHSVFNSGLLGPMQGLVRQTIQTGDENARTLNPEDIAQLPLGIPVLGINWEKSAEILDPPLDKAKVSPGGTLGGLLESQVFAAMLVAALVSYILLLLLNNIHYVAAELSGKGKHLGLHESTAIGRFMDRPDSNPYFGNLTAQNMTNKGVGKVNQLSNTVRDSVTGLAGGARAAAARKAAAGTAATGAAAARAAASTVSRPGAVATGAAAAGAAAAAGGASAASGAAGASRTNAALAAAMKGPVSPAQSARNAGSTVREFSSTTARPGLIRTSYTPTGATDGSRSAGWSPPPAMTAAESARANGGVIRSFASTPSTGAGGASAQVPRGTSNASFTPTGATGGATPASNALGNSLLGQMAEGLMKLLNADREAEEAEKAKAEREKEAAEKEVAARAAAADAKVERAANATGADRDAVRVNADGSLTVSVKSSGGGGKDAADITVSAEHADNDLHIANLKSQAALKQNSVAVKAGSKRSEGGDEEDDASVAIPATKPELEAFERPPAVKEEDPFAPKELKDMTPEEREKALAALYEGAGEPVPFYVDGRLVTTNTERLTAADISENAELFASIDQLTGESSAARVGGGTVAAANVMAKTTQAANDEMVGQVESNALLGDARDDTLARESATFERQALIKEQDPFAPKELKDMTPEERERAMNALYEGTEELSFMVNGELVQTNTAKLTAAEVAENGEFFASIDQVTGESSAERVAKVTAPAAATAGTVSAPAVAGVAKNDRLEDAEKATEPVAVTEGPKEFAAMSTVERQAALDSLFNGDGPGQTFTVNGVEVTTGGGKLTAEDVQYLKEEGVWDGIATAMKQDDFEVAMGARNMADSPETSQKYIDDLGNYIDNRVVEPEPAPAVAAVAAPAAATAGTVSSPAAAETAKNNKLYDEGKSAEPAVTEGPKEFAEMSSVERQAALDSLFNGDGPGQTFTVNGVEVTTGGGKLTAEDVQYLKEEGVWDGIATAMKQDDFEVAMGARNMADSPETSQKYIDDLGNYIDNRVVEPEPAPAIAAATTPAQPAAATVAAAPATEPVAATEGPQEFASMSSAEKREALDSLINGDGASRTFTVNGVEIQTGAGELSAEDVQYLKNQGVWDGISDAMKKEDFEVAQVANNLANWSGSQEGAVEYVNNLGNYIDSQQQTQVAETPAYDGMRDAGLNRKSEQAQETRIASAGTASDEATYQDELAEQRQKEAEEQQILAEERDERLQKEQQERELAQMRKINNDSGDGFA